MNTINNLFDTRGGTLLNHRCEICNEELEEESRMSTCADCNATEDDEE